MTAAARRRLSRVRGDRYSRVVAFLKRLLPMIGVALLLLVAAWPRLVPLFETVKLTVSGIDLRGARELNMLNPRYAGTDRLNRPYVITAAVGHQLPNRSDLMSLEKPRAEMIVHGGATVVLTAATAMYQSQPQLLDLFGDVTLTHQNGSRFVTQRAHANLANDTAEGNVPVEGHGPSGDIWGQGFRILDKGDTIVFTGDSRAILRGTKATETVTQPSEPPSRGAGNRSPGRGRGSGAGADQPATGGGRKARARAIYRPENATVPRRRGIILQDPIVLARHHPRTLAPPAASVTREVEHLAD